MTIHRKFDTSWRTAGTPLEGDHPAESVGTCIVVETDSDGAVAQAYVTVFTDTPEFRDAPEPTTFETVNVHLSPVSARQLAGELDELADYLEAKASVPRPNVRVRGWRWQCGSCGAVLLSTKEPRPHWAQCPHCQNPEGTEVPWEHANWIQADAPAQEGASANVPPQGRVVPQRDLPLLPSRWSWGGTSPAGTPLAQGPHGSAWLDHEDRVRTNLPGGALPHEVVTALHLRRAKEIIDSLKETT